MTLDNTAHDAKRRVDPYPTWIAQEPLAPCDGDIVIPDWLFQTPSSFERDAPIMILLMGFLSWALVTVLFLGFTAPAVVALKLFGLSLAGMGVAWMIWMGWNYLRGSPR